MCLQNNHDAFSFQSVVSYVVNELVTACSKILSH